MALVNEKTEATGTTAQSNSAEYYAAMANDGLDNFTPETMGRAYLAMVQPGSTAELNHAPGTWRDTASDENLGTDVEVVVLDFATVWTERSKDPPYNTVGQYQPYQIPVDIEHPKAGTRGFPKMVNPDTGNTVQELFVYACMLKNSPEAGILFFSPTIGSMKTCKMWNKLLSSQHITLPDGKRARAPIHAYSWTITAGLVQNPAKPNNPNEKIAKFVDVQRGELLDPTMHAEQVKPKRLAMLDVPLIAAPDAVAGDDATDATA